MGALLLASAIWAFSFGLLKTALGGYDPLAVAAGRLALCLVLFLPWLRRGPGAGGVRLRLAALGAVQFGLMYALYIASFRWLPAYAVALFTVFTPLYVVLLDDLGRRTLHPRHLAAALLSVAGAGWVAWQALPPGASWPGIALLQGANLCFAAGQLGYRRLRRTERGTARSEAGNLAWMYLGATAFAVAAMAAAGRPADLLALTPRAGWALLYLGLLPSGVAFYLWNRGAARVGAGALAAANNLKVPLGVAVAWTVFGEPAPYARVLLGLVVVTAAVLWAVWEEKRPEQS